MTEQAEVSAELETFIRTEAGLHKKSKNSGSTTLEADLGITGDDASNLMIAYFERFKVEGGDFDFHRYFAMEGFSVWPFSILTNWLHRRWGIRQYEHREPLTIGMLQHAIELGQWESERLSASAKE